MILMDWIKKLTDIIMPLEPVEEDEIKETKKVDAKTAESSTETLKQPIQNAQPVQSAQPAAQTFRTEKQSATGSFAQGLGTSMSFTRNGGMVSTSDNGVTSMDGVRYEAYSSETSVRPSLAVVKTPQLTMKIYTPTKFDEQVKDIAQDLIKHNAVIVNFEGADESEQQRIGDFVIGAVYTIHGKAEMISNRIVLYVPSGVEYEHAAKVASSSMRRYN